MRIRLPNAWQPRPYQRKAWAYLEAGGKHCELVWHRRSGKDDLALHRTAVASFERVGNYWHTLPKAVQARRAIWDAVNPHSGKRRIDEAFPRELRAGTNDQEMKIRFVNGSTWQVVGSDNFDTLVGSPPLGISFSEWALCDPRSWAYLRPIIAENGGWAIFNTTPRGKNHAFRTFKAAQNEADHYAELLTAYQTDVFTRGQLDSERRQLIEDYGKDFGLSIYEQEYECSFEAANLGAILGRWLVRAEQAGRIIDDAYDPDGADIEISSDIGFRDTAAWWFWQPRADGFGIVEYDGDSGLEAKDWIGRIKDKGYRIGKIWLPHDARAKTFATKHSPMEQFLEAFGSGVVNVVPRTNDLDRINAARTVVEHCYFSRRKTEKGVDGLASWQYEYDEERKEFSKNPRHDWASHPGDGFSYGALVMRERAMEQKKEEAAKTLQVGPVPGGATLNDLWRTQRPADRRY